MSEENVEDFVRKAYAELNRALGERSGEQLRVYLNEYWHPDAVYVNPPDAPEPGAHRGIEAVWRQTRRWVEPYPDLQIEPLEIQTNGDVAFVWVRFSGRGAGSGVPFDQEWADLFTLVNGQVVREQVFFNRAEALEAAGLSE